MINPLILETLTSFGITHKDGIPYLLSVFYGYDPSYVPDMLKRKILTTNIYRNTSTGIEWEIPLFEDQLTNFEWVKSYVKEFKDVNPSVPGSVAECTRRFKKFFAQNPNYTVEDVKQALKLYKRSLNDFKYISWPHYFINKDGYSLLETWIQEHKKQQAEFNERSSKTNTMQ